MGHYSINITVDLFGHPIPSSNREAIDHLDTAVPKPTLSATNN
jgi:hypothetical protein